MATFAKGKRSLAISDRSGLAFPYIEMVFEWNGAFVHYSEYEPKHPQLEPKPTGADPQGLQFARPARTEPPTADLLPEDAFVITASSTTVTVNEPFSKRVTGDVVRFNGLSNSVGETVANNIQMTTTLASLINATTTTISLVDSSNFPSSGYIMIEKVNPITLRYENEVISYTGNSANTLTGCVRGTTAPTRGITLGNTTATIHEAGSSVYGAYEITMVSTTIPNPGVPSTITVENSYTFNLVSAATTSAIGGGTQAFAGPINDRA
jgi:hypothetical protein